MRLYAEKVVLRFENKISNFMALWQNLGCGGKTCKHLDVIAAIEVNVLPVLLDDSWITVFAVFIGPRYPSR